GGERRRRRIGRAVDLHRPGVRRQRARDHVEECALAGAVLADQRVDLARRQVQVDAVERHRRAEALAKSRKGEHRLASGYFRYWATGGSSSCTISGVFTFSGVTICTPVSITGGTFW